MTVFISSLSILVAILIGWQIYQTVGIERKIRSLDKKYNAILESKVKRIVKYTDAMTEFIEGIVVLSNPNTTNYIIAYNTFVFALSHYIDSEMGDNDMAQLCIDNMETSIQKCKKGTIDIVYNTKTTDMINKIIRSGKLSYEQTIKICELEKTRKSFSFNLIQNGHSKEYTGN